MNRSAIMIIALQAVVIVILFWALVFYGRDEYESFSHKEIEEEIESASRAGNENGAAVVNISQTAQQNSGIATATLKAATYQTSHSSFGTVIDIQPLIELRTRYLSAQAEAEVIRASITNSRQEYQRLLLLNQDNRNVSDRAVAAAESIWKEDLARLTAANTSAASIRDSMIQQWGTKLSEWATSADGAAIKKLLQFDDALLRITLPFDAPAPSLGATLMIEPVGAQSKPVKATYISVSSQTDATRQGSTYYFRAPAGTLRAGMHVTVYLSEQGKAKNGVIVPANAVVWYANKAWVYQKEDAERFIRKPVSTDHETGGGWFNNAELREGDEVIISGAQLLLSEEFKYQIKNENED